MILWLMAAQAASLDLPEVAGLWGTPGADDASAMYWNPAGIAVKGGTRFLVEGAPVLASVRVDRQNPVDAGRQDYRFFGVVPFVGVVTDAGVKGLGIEVSLAVPQARGAKAVEQEGPGRSHMRNGNIQAIHASVGAAYNILDKVSLGASVSYVRGSWFADLDTEYGTALADEVSTLLGRPQTEGNITDADLEDPRYNTRARFGPLISHDVTFAVGIHARPIPELGIALSYHHGWAADHGGTVDLAFGCPPDDDAIERFGAEARGLCDADMVADARVLYRYPSRVHLGIVAEPVDRLRLEAFGGWVGWSSYRDFDIRLDNVVSQNTEVEPEIAEKVATDRLWARENRNTFFVGLDAKGQVHERVLVGGRVSYDHPAVPTALLSPNNYDAQTLAIGALVAATPVKGLQIGLSFTESVALSRTNLSSVFSNAVDPALRPEDRLRYPAMNGRYRSSIHRFGVSVRGDFPTRRDRPPASDDAAPEAEELLPLEPSPQPPPVDPAVEGPGSPIGVPVISAPGTPIEAAPVPPEPSPEVVP